MSDRLPTGKLDPLLLERCLALCPTAGPGVLLGPGLGEDAAVLEPGEAILVATCDPVTFATDRLGWYAVQVAANDVATRGADPRWLLLTLLLPEGSTTAELALSLFEEVGEACRALGIVLVGGHTEVTSGLRRPIASASLLGVAPGGRWLSTRAAQPGDLLLLVGSCGVEGTAVLAREFAPALRARGVGEGVLERAAAYLDCPGISVVEPARLLRAIPGMHALHDPTEGGVVCGLWELAAAAGCRARVRLERMPVRAETEELCRALGADPLRLIASGALLVACTARAAEEAERVLVEHGYEGRRVGVLEAGSPAVWDETGGRELVVTARDELARLLDGAET